MVSVVVIYLLCSQAMVRASLVFDYSAFFCARVRMDVICSEGFAFGVESHDGSLPISRKTLPYVANRLRCRLDAESSLSELYY